METTRDFRSWGIPDELWEAIKPLLPEPRPKKRSGRPSMPARQAMGGILYVLETGCQWKKLPPDFGAPSTVHDWFQRWTEAGVFQRMWEEGLARYDKLAGIQWSWQSMDGATTKAPLGGEKNRAESN